MKKLLICILSIGATIAYSDPVSDALIATAHAEGATVYTACILTPPITPSQVATCTALYAKYVVSLQAVNAPMPLIPSTTPSIYAWSPYDICKFEPSHFVFPVEAGIPTCIASPVL